MEIKPYKPKFLNNIFTGTFLGLSIGLIIALLRDRVDNVFHSPDELAKKVNITNLATIPYLSNVKNLFEKDDKSETNKKNKFFALEAFRYLFTSLQTYKDKNNDKYIFAISSSIPSEGKTLISILLSKVIASMDKKVLLIDADMRKSNLHNELEINNDYGLSDILIDDKYSWEKGVQIYKGNQFLEIITSGSQTNDPAKLLGSLNFKNFLEKIKEKNKYEFVIINNTPLIGLTDALLVAERVDSVLITVSINKVNKKFLMESLLRLSKNSKVDILGFVSNYLMRYEYQYYGYSNNLNYSDTYFKYFSQNLELSEENNIIANKVNILIRKNKYIYRFYKNFNKFIRWLNK